METLGRGKAGDNWYSRMHNYCLAENSDTFDKSGGIINYLFP